MMPTTAMATTAIPWPRTKKPPDRQALFHQLKNPAVRPGFLLRGRVSDGPGTMLGFSVMAGLVPAIHVFPAAVSLDVDGRNKSGHDTLRDTSAVSLISSCEDFCDRRAINPPRS
jgi:hypothetical protein